MLAEKPQDVYRFYSHESFFAHGTEPPVQGPQKIQKAIERLAFVDCKARIYTVTGTTTLSNGLVIQACFFWSSKTVPVCGELSIRDAPGRRFLQTFVLCPQTPKKYYVHNDVFQWLDHAFGDDIIPQPKKTVVAVAAVPPPTNTVEEKTITPNGDVASINGHVESCQNLTEELEKSSSPKEEERPVQNVQNSTTVTAAVAMVEENAGGGDRKSMNDMASSKSDLSYLEEITPTDDSCETVQNSAPKTWAKLVGENYPNHSYGVAMAAQLHTIQQPLHAPMRVAVIHSSHSSVLPNAVTNNSTTHHPNSGDDSCRLYVGGIVRNIFADNPSLIERDIRHEFEKFGPVAAVSVPRRVLEHPDPQRTVFAFVVMKTADGARNAFGATRKERSLSLLRLKIDSLGFDGETNLGLPRSGIGVRIGRGHRALHARQHNGGGGGGGGDYRQPSEPDRR
ncbi:unnamed protein product [Gongylonema pulchrum]|uniref:NTF2 domain-containing protein n=1 Tax=Gongylonema pulchrum TaxID=637853 RepID=A0A183E0X1_9BILA|nr:unnamed protein product [Gongylonema pulchrum]